MHRIKGLWEAFKTFAILLSFIINMVVIVTLVIVGTQIFQIKNNIAEPLIDGLHSSFVGLDKSTIDRVIPVRDEIPVTFDLPLNQDTMVVLTAPVPLNANASFNLPGGGGTINGTVSLSLPTGMQLPVTLDLIVPVDTTIPVSLDVRAVIPVQETQLHDPIQNLTLLLDPFVRALDNLPGDGAEGREFVTQILSGNGKNLLEPTEGSMYPWPGYSMTAGDGYVWPDDTPPQPGSSTGTIPGGLTSWDAAPGAPDALYIPYGMIGPAGILPAGDLLIDGNSPSMAYSATASGLPEESTTEGESVVPSVEPTVVPEGGDMGIITPVPES